MNSQLQQEKIKQLKHKTRLIVERLSQFDQGQYQLFLKFFQTKTQVGKNFIGKWVNQKIVGVGLYFVQKQNYFNILFGELVNGRLNDAGFIIKIYKNPQIAANIQNLQSQALFLNIWRSKDLRGAYYSKDSKQNQTFYKGQFSQDKQFKKGLLQVKNRELLIKRYQGSFKKGQFHGEGQLFIPGSYKYQGHFQNSLKDGFGVQENFKNNTIYIGNFESHQKEGYGEITYLGQKVIKLKGFWKEGIMENQQGVFLDQNGEQICLFDRHLTRLF